MKKGFSLIELMVVVAVIGVLATLAIPRYQKYSARARQSSVKTNLAAVFTVERTFWGEYGTYTHEWPSIGFVSATTKNPYAYGTYTGGQTLATLGLAKVPDPPNWTNWPGGMYNYSASASGTCFYNAGMGVFGFTLSWPAGAPLPVMNQDHFRVFGVGCLKPTTAQVDGDLWLIDELRALIHGQDGL